MSNWKSPLWGLGILLAAMFVAVMWATLAVFNGPRWQISATNADAGLQIDVFKEGEDSPTFTTLLPSRRVEHNIARKTIDELPKEVGQTTFTDETVKPGRWTLVIDSVELDIMERALIIDGETELGPANDSD
jgi:hypothetical protein